MKKLLFFILFLLPLNIHSAALHVIAPQQIASGIFTITEAGLYVMGGDAVATITAGAAITITTSDVTIDLQGKSIRASGAADTGINIGSNGIGYENITIRNGKILGFNGRGIFAVNGSQNLFFEDLTISGTSPLSNGFIGFYLFGNPGLVRTTNVNVKNCQTSNGQYGTYFASCDNINMINSSFNNNNQQGLFLQNCNTMLFQNCYANVNTHNGCLMDTCNNITFMDSFFNFNGVAGILTENACNCLTIQHCQFSNNSGGMITGAANSSFGISVSVGSNLNASIIKDSDFSFNMNIMRGTGAALGGSNIVVENCTFNGNGATGASALEAEGVELGETFSSIMRNCIANGNFSSTSTAAGFRFDAGSSGNVLENCIALGNFTTSTLLNAYGFMVGAALPVSDISLINCKAQANSALSPALGIGFFINANSPNCIVENCQALSNTHTGFSINPSSAVLVGNLAMGNPTNYAGLAVTGGTVGRVTIANGTQPTSTAFDTRQIDNIAVGLP